MILYTLTHTSRKSQYHFPRTVTTYYPSMVKAREANRAIKAQGTEGVVTQVNVPTTVVGLIAYLNSLPGVVHDAPPVLTPEGLRGIKVYGPAPYRAEQVYEALTPVREEVVRKKQRARLERVK